MIIPVILMLCVSVFMIGGCRVSDFDRETWGQLYFSRLSHIQNFKVEYEWWNIGSPSGPATAHYIEHKIGQTMRMKNVTTGTVRRFDPRSTMVWPTSHFIFYSNRFRNDTLINRLTFIESIQFQGREARKYYRLSANISKEYYIVDVEFSNVVLSYCWYHRENSSEKFELMETFRVNSFQTGVNTFVF